MVVQQPVSAQEERAPEQPRQQEKTNRVTPQEIGKKKKTAHPNQQVAGQNGREQAAPSARQHVEKQLFDEDMALMTAALDESEDVIAALETELAHYRSDLDYASRILRARGVPNDVNGVELSLSDKIMYVLSQYGIVYDALDELRTAIMQEGHQFHQQKQIEEANRMFGLLEDSAQAASFVAVSSR